jgi:hypothetical protein
VPNELGSLLDPIIYRDIEISCMYLVEDVIKDMLVPEDENVPPYVPPVFSPMFSPNAKCTTFKAERRSDYSTGAYEPSIKKVRKSGEYPVAQAKFKNMLGDEGDDNVFKHKETMYILRCLDTSCTVSSLFAGLNHYPHSLINSILQHDFDYSDDTVTKNKANLMVVCEKFLNACSTLPTLNII